MQTSILRKQIACMMVSGYILLTVYHLFASDFITLYTPKKTEISGFIFNESSQQRLEEKDRYYENIIREMGWHVKKISGSSSTYNSHGYAWHMYNGGDAIVIDGDDVQWYWVDGSYKEINENETAEGDIILMTDPDDTTSSHSAVVSDAPGWCLSKWQDGPLFLHKFDEHPFGKSLRFYRKSAPAAPQNLRIISK